MTNSVTFKGQGGEVIHHFTISATKTEDLAHRSWGKFFEQNQKPNGPDGSKVETVLIKSDKATLECDLEQYQDLAYSEEEAAPIGTFIKEEKTDLIYS